MVQLTDREWRIVQYLLVQEDPVTMALIARHCSVSVRTIRSAIAHVDFFLSQLNISLIRRNGVGVWVDDKFLAIKKLSDNTRVLDDSMYRVFSKDERMKKIIDILFLNDQHVTMKKLADIMFIHRSTVLKSLADAEKWFKDRGILIVKQPKLGIRIDGSEISVRLAWRQYINQTFSYEVMHDVLYQQGGQHGSSFSHEHLEKLKGQTDTKAILNAVNRFSKQTGITFSDETICDLIAYFCISILRIRRGRAVSIAKDKLSNCAKTAIFPVVAELVRSIEIISGVNFDDSEIYAVMMIFDISRIKGLDETKFTPKMTPTTFSIVEAYITKIGVLLNLPLWKDSLLSKNLLMHIHVTLNHLNYNLPVHNPIAMEVKKEYPDYYIAVQKANEEIKQTFNFSVNDDELAYITMHILGAIERLNQNKKTTKIQVVVACASAIGSSKLLSARLSKEFEEIEIVNEISVSQIQQYASKIDLIITTIAVQDTSLVPIVTVSPLLTSYEVTKIRKTIDEIRGRRVDTGVGQIKEIINIVSQFGRIENTEQLAEMLELRLYGKKQKQAKRGMLVLSDMLSLSRIKIKAPVRNKYDAIRQTGELLCMDGLATPEYTDAMLRLFEELGAYIVISPGVAMPHARADAGAKKTGFAIVTPREPVDFGHEKNDPVRIILALVATDNKSHLQAMKELSLLISQEDVFEELINSDTPDMMLTRILRFEEQMALKK